MSSDDTCCRCQETYQGKDKNLRIRPNNCIFKQMTKNRKYKITLNKCTKKNTKVKSDLQINKIDRKLA